MKSILACVAATTIAFSEPLLLTPLLNEGKTAEARKKATITGDSAGLGYSGFFSVPAKTAAKEANQTNNIFTWFQPCSEGCDAATAPFILWLQGGPGGPGEFGALSEIGSWYPKGDNTLAKRCYSWCKTANCLFVDQPVKTGLSFATNSSGGVVKDKDIVYTATSEEAMGQVHGVVTQVLEMFPEYDQAPFYVTGESYGGLYTAWMGKQILAHNAAGDKKNINFKGLAVGDPIINATYQWPTYADTLYGFGVIDTSERAQLKTIFTEGVAAINAQPQNCPAAFEKWNSVWADDSGGCKGYFHNMTGSCMTENILLNAPPAQFDRFFPYITSHLADFNAEGAPLSSGDEGGDVYHTMVDSGDFCNSSSQIYGELLLAGIDIMIYSSSVDPLLGPPTTEAGVGAIFDWMAVQADGTDAENAWKASKKVVWSVEEKEGVAGYARCTGGIGAKKNRFCYTVVRNGGHELPAFQPRNAQDMWERFLDGRSFAPNDNNSTLIPDCVQCAGVGPFAGDIVLQAECDASKEDAVVGRYGFLGIGLGVGLAIGVFIAWVALRLCSRHSSGNVQDSYNYIE